MNIQYYVALSICLFGFSLLLCAWPSMATSGEIKVFAPGGVRSALLGAASAFERETGHKVNFTFGTAEGYKNRWPAEHPPM